MKNKNMMLFIVLSMGLLGIYMWLMPKPQQQPPAPPTAAQESAPTPAPAAPAVVPTAQAVPAPVGAPAVDPKALFTWTGGDLELTWRKQDGALVQAVWKQDGTKFFPEEMKESGKPYAPGFLGLGGVTGTLFEGDPEVQDGAVRFRNAQGDALTYRLDRGHVLRVEWQTTKGAPMTLLRGLKEMPKDAEGKEIDPLLGLGRVFTLGEKNIDAVAWIDTLKDPWYSFLGGKRKAMPFAASRLGMDAGMEKSNAQRTHYFAALWETSGTVQLDMDRAPGYHLAPAADGRASARLYLGPKRADDLSAFGKPFVQVMDFGFFGLVAKGMFWILFSIQKAIPNWGWAIVVFSILLRLALWPLNNKTTIQLLRMKDLEPHQKVIQAKYEKFGSDMQKKAEMQKELMAFYKKNGHNPMGGCLPMLLQMPVFFALWSMLSAVFELRHAHWMLWITDLSGPDKFYVLPILLGASMIAQQAMTPATGDPAQRKMMMWLMPAMMTFFFANTPAGLCLYYLIFNLIGMAQTWWVMRTYKPQPVVI